MINEIAQNKAEEGGLSLKEVCNRIATHYDDVALISRRIRHWTNEKLIPTTGDVHSGKGKHRLYDLDGLLTSAILWELSRFNVPVGVLDKILPALKKYKYFMNKVDPIVDEKVLAEVPIWLAITFDKKNEKFNCEEFGENIKKLEEDSSAIILNTQKIADTVYQY